MPPRKPRSEHRYPRARKRVTVQPKHCGVRLRSGGACSQPAGHRTDHPGIGPCLRHGGQTASALKTVGAELAYLGIMDPDVTAADLIEIEPHNGLLIAVRSAAGEFFFWQQRLRQLSLDKGEGMDKDEYKAEYDALIRDLRQSRDAMARISKMAIDAGLAERQVVLQERMAELMVRFAQELVAQLPLTDKQERLVPKAMETALLAIEGGAEYARTPKPKQALRNYKKSDVIDIHDAA